MKVLIFCHSITSCWNHGNAHFLRGIARELIRRGHAITAFEPEDGWSRMNATADGGSAALEEAARLVPGLEIVSYAPDTIDLDRATDHADVALVHEWNTPALVGALGRRRIAGARYTLLFHDTHHRAATAIDDMSHYELDGYDGVLAFGEVLRDIYVRRGWTRQAFTWHEAADIALFQPSHAETAEHDLIWIGNWGDEERSHELAEFVIEPSAKLRLRTRIHGVRYPQTARTLLNKRNIDYAGWLPNHRVPAAFAHSRFTVHVPRRPYTKALPGIPTIRVFEALACGIPLISAPWDDCEGLFPAGAYLSARNGLEMVNAMSAVLNDQGLAGALRRTGLQAIKARHTCAHRVQELEAIIASFRQPRQARPRKAHIGAPLP